MTDPVPLRCEKCGGMNKPNASPTIEINNGTVSCVNCGHTWIPKPPPKDAA